MARRTRTPQGPTPVESIKHADKRKNIPTADAREFVDPQFEQIKQVAFERDPSLDPQLIWRGKYPEDDPTRGTDLLADAPPIYIQEKIDPQVLIENLRRTAERPADEPEFTLFDDFDGLAELDLVDFYRHDANWSNRMILGDSLQVMSSLAERELLRGKVQMIYIDPPYGIKFGSNWQVSARNRVVKDGNLEDAAREAEQIKAFRDTWELGIHSYLSYLRDRLLAARELLTESGSCFVQIGDENAHLVRSLMDEVFGSENFVSQVVFSKTSGATALYLPATADYLLWYAVNHERLKYKQIYQAKSVTGAGGAEYVFEELPDGSRVRISGGPPEGRPFRIDNLTSPRVRENRTGYFPVRIGTRDYLPGAGEWKTHQQGMRKLVAAGRVVARSNSLGYVRYIDDFPVMALTSRWDDTGVAGRPGDKIYVVQTNTKVVERCMLMCTDPGDLVLDPTCGSGTTAYVAEQWGRRWISIDTSRVALALARQRLMGARFPYYLLADSAAGKAKEAEVTGNPPSNGLATDDIRHGFVYERVQHITLKSIANNPDIKEGMTREQIDAAIKRHADFEMLYDRPYEDKRKVRVTGPFTVESLSPHRSLAFAGGDEFGRETQAQRAAAMDPDAPTFEQSILDNLEKAGIQNGQRAERITFSVLQSHAGTYLQAVGERSPDENDTDAAPTRVGVAIGPQYGTVDAKFIKNAVREAIHADIDMLDLVCVLGFAFDPQATGVTEDDGVTIDPASLGFASVAAEKNLAGLKVLLVRMNADLLMGEELKKTGAGNLFTVFGAPDIELRETDGGQIVAALRGVDVYDPTAGKVRSDDTGRIALWMIDTDYNEESFFVRHCYFTGGNDPYKRLKVALKADIDAEAWETLYRTESRPFHKPESGKVAVKVINDYGDEVMKVFEVN